MATVTVMADKIARLTDIRAKSARLCGYRTPYNGPTKIGRAAGFNIVTLRNVVDK